MLLNDKPRLLEFDPIAKSSKTVTESCDKFCFLNNIVVTSVKDIEQCWQFVKARIEIDWSKA